jgi:hypothetical protein
MSIANQHPAGQETVSPMQRATILDYMLNVEKQFQPVPGVVWQQTCRRGSENVSPG